MNKILLWTVAGMLALGGISYGEDKSDDSASKTTAQSAAVPVKKDEPRKAPETRPTVSERSSREQPKDKSCECKGKNKDCKDCKEKSDKKRSQHDKQKEERKADKK